VRGDKVKISIRNVLIFFLGVSTVALSIALAIQINTNKDLASKLRRETLDLEIQLKNVSEAKNKIQHLQEQLYQVATLCDIYDGYFVNSDNWGINLPLYEYDEKDQEILDKAEEFINSQIDPEKEFVFKIGPIRKKENGEYTIQFITYTKLELDFSKGINSLDENLPKLTGDIPPIMLRNYILKYTNGHIEYIG